MAVWWPRNRLTERGGIDIVVCLAVISTVITVELRGQLFCLPCVDPSAKVIPRSVYEMQLQRFLTHPCLLTVPIRLEEVRALISVVVKFIQALVRCLGCLLARTIQSH